MNFPLNENIDTLMIDAPILVTSILIDGLKGLGYAGNSFILCGKKSSLNELRLEFMSTGSPAWLEISDPKSVPPGIQWQFST